MEKNQRLSLFKRKRFVDLISRAALNEITPRQKFSFKMFGKMLSKRNLLANTLEKSFLTERFNKSYNFFLSDMESLITLNSFIGKWWFKPHVAFYKKRRFIVPTMLTRVIKNYYLRPLHLRSQRGLRAWLLFTPVLRLSRKIMSHDLSKLYPKKINIIFKWVYNSNMTAQVLLAYLVSRLEKLYLPREIIPFLLQKFEGRMPMYKNGVLLPRKPGMFGTSFSGLTFKCSGRFTRAQMASTLFFRKGKMPLSTIHQQISYAFGTLSLKYGALGLKIYLAKKHEE